VLGVRATEHDGFSKAQNDHRACVAEQVSDVELLIGAAGSSSALSSTPRRAAHQVCRSRVQPRKTHRRHGRGGGGLHARKGLAQVITTLQPNADSLLAAGNTRVDAGDKDVDRHRRNGQARHPAERSRRAAPGMRKLQQEIDERAGFWRGRPARQKGADGEQSELGPVAHDPGSVKLARAGERRSRPDPGNRRHPACRRRYIKAIRPAARSRDTSSTGRQAGSRGRRDGLPTVSGGEKRTTIRKRHVTAAAGPGPTRTGLPVAACHRMYRLGVLARSRQAARANAPTLPQSKTRHRRAKTGVE